MELWRTTAISLAAVLAALFAIALLAESAREGPAAVPAPRVEIEGGGLYPRFHPERHHYVARCGPGAPRLRVDAGDGTRVRIGSGRARSGSFAAATAARPGEDFELGVDQDGQAWVYQVRCLPRDFPAWSFERLRPGPRGMFTVAFRSPKLSRPWIVVFDGSGTPLWWHSPARPALWARVLADGNLAWPRSFGDGYGRDPRMALEIRSPTGELLELVRTRGSITDGHEYELLPGGDRLLVTYAPSSGIDLSRFGGPSETSVVFAEIQQVDPEGRVVWRWNSRRHIALAETGRWWYYVLSNPHPGPGGADTYDAVHINSIDRWGRDRLIITARHTDAVFAIDRTTGRILWKLGGTPTPRSLRFVGGSYPAHRLFGGAHDARIDGQGRLSIFDNATHRPRPPRVFRYDLDLRRRTATLVDTLTDPEVRRSHCCGSARPLDGGWIVSWGDNPLVSGFDAAGRLAFRLHLPAPSFRAVPVPAGAASPESLDRALERVELGR